MPGRVVATAGANLVTASRMGATGIIKLIIKHWYLISIFIFLIPSIVGSVQFAIETQNPSYPFIQLGLRITNADAVIYEDVGILQETPKQYLPERGDGMWASFKELWDKVRLAWRFLGNIFLISIPFVVFYKLFRTRNTSEPAKNFLLSFIIGFGFILLINLLIVVVGLIDGSFLTQFTADMDIYKKTWLVIQQTLPFRGIVRLIVYGVGL